MNIGGGPGIFQILKLLFYTVLTVRYYTIISLFLDSVHPVRSKRQSYSHLTGKENLIAGGYIRIVN